MWQPSNGGSQIQIITFFESYVVGIYLAKEGRDLFILVRNTSVRQGESGDGNY